MKNILWGVISTANIAQQQLIPAIGRASNAELVAISSRGSQVHAVASKLGVSKAYESYEELLNDPDIEAVYIPLPNHLHKEWVFKAAKQGKHVLCEKPVSLTAQEAEEMVEICRENNVKFMEAFMYQLHPQHKRVKEIMSSGEIGDIKLIKSSHSFYMQSRENKFRMDKTMGGGSLYDVGCYSIHAIRYLLDTEPISVQCSAELDPETGVDMSAFGYLNMGGGVRAMFDCSFDMTERNEYEIIGTKGTIKVPFAFRPDNNGGVGKIITQVADMVREENIYGDLYRLEVEHFSDAIKGNSDLEVTGISTINNMRVIEACYQSIQSGELVEMK